MMPPCRARRQRRAFLLRYWSATTAAALPRRDYYRFKPGGWNQYLRHWLGLMSALHQITERGLGLLADKPAELRQRLLEAHDLFSLMEERFPAILETLEATPRGQRGSTG